MVTTAKNEMLLLIQAIKQRCIYCSSLKLNSFVHQWAILINSEDKHVPQENVCTSYK